MSEPGIAMTRTMRPLHVPKVADLVADDIRRDIARGIYVDGAELPQGTELMARYQISRPTLREALRVLASESLLEMTAGTTMVRVRLPSSAVAARYAGLMLQLRGTTLRDLDDTRASIEAPAARLFVERGAEKPAVLDDLEEAIDAEAAALKAADQVAVGRAGLHIHEAVVALSGNTTLFEVFALLGSVVEQHADARFAQARRAARQTGLDDLRKAHRVHKKFLDLARTGEIDKAQRHWQQHLERMNAAYQAGDENSHVVDLF